MTHVFAAADLGASSGRVLAGVLGGGQLTLREVHRFGTVPVQVQGTLHTDVLALFQGIVEGLRQAARTAGTPDSVGVDGWGVDYGLLDDDGVLLGNPVHYRDGRTAAVLPAALASVGADRLYAATGTAVQPFNTVFQLIAERGRRQLALASRALLIPDLMTYWLSGEAATELTNASTTGLLDSRTRDWCRALATTLDVPLHLFGDVHPPGVTAGGVLPGVNDAAGLDGCTQVTRVASHDTASAVAAIPALTPDFGYVSAGTWALAGLELAAPVITPASRAAGFTNEAGYGGTVRFLRNITGFWLLQECIRDWQQAGRPAGAAELMTAAGDVPPLLAVFDVNEPVFVPPGDMPGRIRAACRRFGFAAPQSPAELVRCILESLAIAITLAIRRATELAGREARVLHVVGGGAASDLFCQLVADASERRVVAGPVEAAAWGNVLVQAAALGLEDAASLEAGRDLVRRSIPVRTFVPGHRRAAWDRAIGLVAARRRGQAEPGAAGAAGYSS